MLTADGKDLAELLVARDWREFREREHRCQTPETRERISHIFPSWNRRLKPSGAADGLKCSREILGNHRGQTERGGLVVGNDSRIDADAGKLYIVDAHRDDGSRFAVGADELLTAFLELKKVTTLNPAR